MKCEICKKKDTTPGNILPRDKYTTTYFSLFVLDGRKGAGLCLNCEDEIANTIIKLSGGTL